MNGKPVFEIDVKSVINLRSKFREKLLCDGPTFSAGTACAYCCSFCFVEAQHARNSPVQTLLKSQNVSFDEIVIRRRNAAAKVTEILKNAKGEPRFPDPMDTRVIYASPLVDVAANIELVNETIEICRSILKLTHWHIRLLSKSNLLPKIATALEDYRDRLIFGVSTGTLDNKLAAAFEQNTALVSKRIESLHWLQDNAFRTFAMVCPSLPQHDYLNFAKEMAQVLRINKCEHYWAEALNVRGKSMTRTVAALIAGGFKTEACMLQEVSKDAKVWENYSRETFLAHTQFIPAEKLRFLQYVKKEHLAFWQEHAPLGAVLLGKYAHVNRPDKDTTVGPNLSPTTTTIGLKIPNPRSAASTKAWKTMRERYSAEEISERSLRAALKAWETRRAQSAQ